MVPPDESDVKHRESDQPSECISVREWASKEMRRMHGIVDARCQRPSEIPDVMSGVAAGVAKVGRTPMRHECEQHEYDGQHSQSQNLVACWCQFHHGRSCNGRFLRHRFSPKPTNVASQNSLPKREHVAKEAVSAAWQTRTRRRSERISKPNDAPRTKPRPCVKTMLAAMKRVNGLHSIRSIQMRICECWWCVFQSLHPRETKNTRRSFWHCD